MSTKKLFFNLFFVFFTTTSFGVNKNNTACWGAMIGQLGEGVARATNTIASGVKVISNHLIKHGQGLQAVATVDKVLDMGALQIKNQTVIENASTTALNANIQEINGSLQTVNGSISKLTDITQAFGKVVLVGQAIGAVAGIYTILHGTYRFGCYTKSFIYPDIEEQFRIENLKKKLEVLRAERKLNHSLVVYANAPEDSDGLPFACKEDAQAYAKAAGHEALDRIRVAFKRRK